MTPDPPTPPTASAPAFSDLGATFNDATRALVGGLWQNVVEEGAQGNGSVFRYVNDLTAVQTGFRRRSLPDNSPATRSPMSRPSYPTSRRRVSAATASVNGGGTFGSVAAAETRCAPAISTFSISSIPIPRCRALPRKTAATGSSPHPTTLADGVTAATAPHANLAEIGVIFNDAASRILGGVNADNAATITDDMNAVITDMQT